MLCVTGCQATRTAGCKIGKASVAATSFIAKGIINGIFDSDDETIFEKERRDQRERRWKQYWREHPDENPAMHDAFRNDYK